MPSPEPAHLEATPCSLYFAGGGADFVVDAVAKDVLVFLFEKYLFAR